MNKKDLEELKKRLEEAEFNNLYEDERIINNEEKKKVNELIINEENDDKKNKIIIGLVICIVVLLIIVFLFLISGNKKDDDNTNKENNNNNNTENENKEDNPNGKDESKDDEKVIKEDDYDYSSAKVFFNKYILITSKDEKKEVITDLDGNIILKVTPSWKFYEGPENSIYAINLNYTEDNNYIVKRIKDNLVHDIIKEKADGLLISKENNKLLGIYKKDTSKDTYYIFDGNNYNTSTPNYLGAYSNTSNEVKNIYNNRFMITFETSGEDFKNYGIFDVRSNKQITDGLYDHIEHLHDDIFVAEKNNKSGIINTDNKILLDFKYEVIAYSNDLYFVGENNKLKVLDKNLNDLNIEIDVPKLNLYSYSSHSGTINPFDLTKYQNSVIVRVGYLPGGTSEYTIVNKNGTKTTLDKGYIGFAGDYLVHSNENDTFINMYDGTMTLKHKIDVQEKAIRLDNINLFLNNTLVINKNKLYNLDTDKTKGTTSWYRRVSQEFDVRIDFKGDKGTVTVSSNEQVLKKLENVSVSEFLSADNNGITITKDYFIYNAGGVIVLKRVPQQ